MRTFRDYKQKKTKNVKKPSHDNEFLLCIRIDT